MLVIWRYAIKKMGPAWGHVFCQEQSQMFAESQTKVTFADVAGIDEAKEELQEVVEFLSNPGKFQKLGAGFRKGTSGWPTGDWQNPSGQGRGREAKVPFFSISGSEFVEMFVGVGARAFAIFSLRLPARPPASSLSMNWTH